jgi:hypothetical protein
VISRVLETPDLDHEEPNLDQDGTSVGNHYFYGNYVSTN